MKPQSVSDIIAEASRPKPKPKPILQFHHGDRVTHERHGKGIVIGEWGSMLVKQANGRTLTCSCLGIYDVEFRNSAGEPYLHCCRESLLTIGTK